MMFPTAAANIAIGECTVRVPVAGLRINRLVATEGQTVRFDKGQLMVDGRLSPWQPQRSVPWRRKRRSLA